MPPTRWALPAVMALVMHSATGYHVGVMRARACAPRANGPALSAPDESHEWSPVESFLHAAANATARVLDGFGASVERQFPPSADVPQVPVEVPVVVVAVEEILNRQQAQPLDTVATATQVTNGDTNIAVPPLSQQVMNINVPPLSQQRPPEAAPVTPPVTLSAVPSAVPVVPAVPSVVPPPASAPPLERAEIYRVGAAQPAPAAPPIYRVMSAPSQPAPTTRPPPKARAVAPSRPRVFSAPPPMPPTKVQAPIIRASSGAQAPEPPSIYRVETQPAAQPVAQPPAQDWPQAAAEVSAPAEPSQAPITRASVARQQVAAAAAPPPAFEPTVAATAPSAPASKESQNGPVLKVVGIGGGGCSTVARMPYALGSNLGESVQLIMLNTDAQALEHASQTAATAISEAAANAPPSEAGAPPAGQMPPITTIPIGENFLYGQGAGGHANWGRDAAMAAADEILEQIDGADMVFVTAGMGGGTGSGAAPVVAELAKAAGCLTVAVVSSPFGFEGGTRSAVADAGIAELREHVDVLVVVQNERLLSLLPPDLPIQETLFAADEVARQAIVGVASLVASSQLINVDLADVRSVMQDAGLGLISIGRASGEGRAAAAVDAALSSPLLDIKLERVTGCAYTVAGGSALTLHEVHEIGQRIKPLLDDNAQVIFGASIDQTLDDDEIVVTLIATGFASPPAPPPPIFDVFAYRPYATRPLVHMPNTHMCHTPSHSRPTRVLLSFRQATAIAAGDGGGRFAGGRPRTLRELPRGARVGRRGADARRQEHRGRGAGERAGRGDRQGPDEKGPTRATANSRAGHDNTTSGAARCSAGGVSAGCEAADAPAAAGRRVGHLSSHSCSGGDAAGALA